MGEAREAHIVRMSTRQPHFDEVVQMLVPPVDDSGKIELMVLDKHAKSLGVVEVNFAEIFFKQDLRFEGPFITDTGIKIHGNMVWRWLSRRLTSIGYEPCNGQGACAEHRPLSGNKSSR